MEAEKLPYAGIRVVEFTHRVMGPTWTTRMKSQR